MATQEELDKLSQRVLAPGIVIQQAEALRLKQMKYAQARFIHVASIFLAICYAGYLIFRVVNGHALNTMSIVLVGFLSFVVFTSWLVLSATKSALPPN